MIGGAVIYAQREFGLNSCHVEVLVAMNCIFAIVGALNAGWISDRFGRTKILAASAMALLIGNLIVAFSVNYPMIFLGRVITGLGVGFGIFVNPLYISELSPTRWRGFLTTFRYSLKFSLMPGATMTTITPVYIILCMRVNAHPLCSHQTY